MPNISGNATAATGDVWTATKVNNIQNNLSEAQTGTADPAGADGDLLVRTDNNTLKFYAGGAWHVPGVAQMSQVTGGSGLTTTSVTYVDMTSMSITLTTTGGVLEATFTGTVYNDTVGHAVVVALSLDGAAEVGERVAEAATANDDKTIAITYRWTGVSAGSHTIKVRWRVSGGTGAADTNRRELLVKEVKLG